MFRPYGDDTVQGRGEHLVSEAVDSENDVQAYILDPALPEHVEGLDRGGAVVAPAHPAEHTVVQRLYPHAHAVHPDLAQIADKAHSPADYVVWVHLNGEFLIRSFGEGLHQVEKKAEGHHRRRASSDVEGLDS